MTRTRWAFSVVGGVIGLGVAAFALSPRPAALVLRVFFKRDSTRLLTAMWAHAPANVVYKENQPYRDNDPDAVFDLYYPSGTTGRLPAVVWIHGGAWISGGAADNVPYSLALTSGNRNRAPSASPVVRSRLVSRAFRVSMALF